MNYHSPHTSYMHLKKILKTLSKVTELALIAGDVKDAWSIKIYDIRMILLKFMIALDSIDKRVH